MPQNPQKFIHLEIFYMYDIYPNMAFLACELSSASAEWLIAGMYDSEAWM